MIRVMVAMFLLAVFATSVFANPKRAAIHNKQGKAYFDAKQYAEAIVEFEKSFELDPKPITLFKIASAFYAKGDYTKAIDYYQKYLTADPDGPFAAQAIEFSTIANKAIADEAAKKRAAEEQARLEAERIKAEAARKEAEAEEERKRLAATARVKQAEAYVQAKAWVSAGQEYTEAAKVGAEPAHLLDAAEAFRKARDNVKARAAYQAYLEQVPLGAKSDEIRIKVAELSLAIEQAKAEAEAEAKEDERQRTQQQTIAVRGSSIEEPKADFELAVSLASGMKRQNDNPFAVAVRAELALRLGKRVNLGLYGEYARIETSGTCGTEIPGPMPVTPFDIGPRNQFTSCSYLMPGMQLYVHVLPKRKIDPYIGVSPGFRFGFADYTTTFGGDTQTHSDFFAGIVTGVRIGVTYRPTLAVRTWTLGGFLESEIQLIGDHEGTTDSGDDSSYITWFLGARSTVTF